MRRRIPVAPVQASYINRPQGNSISMPPTITFTEALARNRIRLLLIVPLLVAAYYRVVPDMVQQWMQDENYSHGFLVPLIAGYFLYLRRDELGRAPVVPWNWGVAVLLFGLAQLILGWLGTEYFTMRSSLVVVLAGLVLFLFGTAPFRVMALPLGYLLFMVPIPYIVYDAVAFPLKLFVTRVSVATLKIAGVSVLREGNIIMFPATTLEVADACSGIRSLISLLALAVALAFFLRIAPWKRWVLVGGAIPIAIVTNASRVIVTGFLAQYMGARAAEGFFHEFAGLAVFGLAMLLLVSLGALLKGREQRTGSEQ
ncbi:eight transmembrane protein EpsH [Pelobacter propionicus DSM 2379]|uniref:Eight transmembrane protein EpsH n=2 Tax=Pelobacter propionicus TaxID=29543 RepID=A1ARS8_PELPD|nr:eight transmembrane protein EpsH [Pelobacter propionicus DSM 2379]